MWPLKKGIRDNSIICVSLSPQYIKCCLISKQNIKNKISINAYEKKELKALEFEKSILFNPTKISSVIKNFITNNSVKNPVISLSVCGPNIFEKIVTLSTSCPTKETITNNFNNNNFNNIKNISLQYTYLCPALNYGFYFYICEIKIEQLFQYKLLAMQTDAKLSCITTERAALISAYKNIQNKTHSQHTQHNKHRQNTQCQLGQGQFAIDFAQSNYDIHNLVTYEDVEKNSIIKNELDIDLKEEHTHIANAMGLFFMGNKL